MSKTATKEEVLKWCVDHDLDFITAKGDPPPGWFWADDGSGKLIIMAVLALDYAGEEITHATVKQYAKSLEMKTRRQVLYWIRKHGDVVAQDLEAPLGWKYVHDRTVKQWHLVPGSNNPEPNKTPIPLTFISTEKTKVSKSQAAKSAKSSKTVTAKKSLGKKVSSPK